MMFPKEWSIKAWVSSTIDWSADDLLTRSISSRFHDGSPVSLENFSDYLKNLQQLPSLQDFFSVYIAKHDLKISQIIKNSGISQSYAHEILNGTKPHPSRDYLLALCLGAHMDLKTTQHALRIAQLGELYAKVPRDAAIMMHINNEKWNLIDINIFLEEHGLTVISLSKKIS